MIKVIGIPYDANSSFLKGPALAPSRIRLMERDGSANAYAESGLEIVDGITHQDVGDLYFDTANAEKVFGLIKQTIAENLTGAVKIVTLGGDHSITYPVIAAYTKSYSNLHILHIDAHADLYDNFDGNPYSHASPFARIMEKGIINSLTQVGIRTLNTHQREQAKKFDVSVIEMKDLDFGFVKKLKGPLYISLDLDGLDPAYAPGVSHHEPGGLSTRDVISMIQKIEVPIVGADIVEYNPTRDYGNTTAMVAYKLLKELIAKMN